MAFKRPVYTGILRRVLAGVRRRARRARRALHLLGLSVQFGVRASEDYDHPFLLFYTFGGFLAKYLYRYSRRHAIRIYPRYKRILVR